MRIRRMRVFAIVGMSAVLAACPSGGGAPATLTLAGDVNCPVPPPTVTGTATLGAGGTTIIANVVVRCAGVGVAGVMLTGEIRTPARTLTFTFPATNALGATVLTDTIPGVIVVNPADVFNVRVRDASGNPVPPDPVGISIQ